MDADLKISKAKATLIINAPFFGAVALRCRFEEKDADWLIRATGFATMATDGRAIYWCREFVDAISEEETLGVIVHEAMHVALKHPLRMQTRDQTIWNIACDIAINNHIVSKEWGYTLPIPFLSEQSLMGENAEEIYRRILKDEDICKNKPKCSWGGVFEAMNEDGSSLSDAEKANLEVEIDQMVEAARTLAKEKSIGSYPSGMDEMIETSRPPQVHWSERLRRVVGGEQPFDYAYRRPNKRMFHTFRTITPGVIKSGTGPVVIGIDTSGSVSTEEMEMILSELRAITEEFMPESVTIIQCDAKIQKVDHYEHGEVIDTLPVKGRGGTMVSPVFKYIEDHDINPDTLIYFSDMEVSDFPKNPPPYQVLWVNTSGHGGYNPPWGEVARLWRG